MITWDHRGVPQASLSHGLDLSGWRGDTLVSVGRLLIVCGLVLVALGVAVTLLSKTSIPFGRLPGDIVWRGKNSAFYFPIVTCLLVSVLASLLVWLLNRR